MRRSRSFDNRHSPASSFDHALMASPGPNAWTGQSRDHEGQALLGSQASARQSPTARRSRAVDRSGERHGRSIRVRVRPHRAPCGASLTRRSIAVRSGRPETGGYPLTIAVVHEPASLHGPPIMASLFQSVQDEAGMRRPAHPPADDPAGRSSVHEKLMIAPRTQELVRAENAPIGLEPVRGRHHERPRPPLCPCCCRLVSIDRSSGDRGDKRSRDDSACDWSWNFRLLRPQLHPPPRRPDRQQQPRQPHPEPLQ